MKRDLTFDIVRALCIVEVVCFWHITNYIDLDLSKTSLMIFGYFTTSVLGAFTFMSGFFLRKYKMDNFIEVKKFYIQRLKRFGLLYFIAALLLYSVSTLAGQPWYPSFTNFVLSLFGLTCFFQPLPPTLWYMVMIMLFYIITPPILSIQSIRGRMIVSIIIYALLMFLNSIDYLDERILCYFPMYALGLIINSKFVEFLKLHAFVTIIVAIVCLLPIIIFSYGYGYNLLFSLLVCLAGFPIILGTSELLSKSVIVKSIATFISYSSLNMYLFHRHFYLGFLILWTGGNFSNIRDATFPMWFAFLVVCPCIIVSCYYIQKLYDIVVSKWWK